MGRRKKRGAGGAAAPGGPERLNVRVDGATKRLAEACAKVRGVRFGDWVEAALRRALVGFYVDDREPKVARGKGAGGAGDPPAVLPIGGGDPEAPEGGQEAA